ncbi:hypothetical protein [Salinicoccus halodurans]|uniref:Uncharacterized protein n=1 Tax=Salinicoccus halodurans TaxID=407035 RepID=A0AA94HH17_9STAP|nr:hypothetical protein [Salinicoccus halodurans]SFK88520.1 hypothetical protein SAMN05216235_2238 [Salinicoccus halodurans]
MFSTDRISADLRMEEYKKIAESYSHISQNKKEAKSKKSFFSKIINRFGA